MQGASFPIDLNTILFGIHEEIHAQDDWGMPAQYIPQLACVDPAQFGMAIVDASGKCITVGDADVPFSIQSVSKVFALISTLGRIGDQLWKRVGREPSGASFDSMVLLESENGRPRNPFVNAGALVVTDALLSGREPKQALAEVLGLIRTLAEDDDIHIDASVARSEQTTGARNKALAHYLDSHDNLTEEPDKVLGTYFHQCAIEMTARQLAMAGRALAGLPGARGLMSKERIRRVNALMMTCGHYDGSGQFAFRVGLPGKSGVGGGILMVAPGQASIAVWSPGLDSYGNSKAGTDAAALLSKATGWSVF
ncbi:MAG: glutaminase [Roseovarius sp.]|nr:glutaminase [Roseovarius sp.]